MTRVSLGAQSFQPRLLDVLERQADARRRPARGAHFSVMPDSTTSRSISSTGSRARAPPISTHDLAEALALEPEHLSCYELEAKPGTRFTHAHGEELARQAEAMEGYFERVVETLTGAGYRWYETANFCLDGERAGGRDLRAHHNLGYWRGRDYLGVGIGAVSTVAGVRRRNLPSLAPLRRGARDAGELPPREVEPIDRETRSARAPDARAAARRARRARGRSATRSTATR